MSIGKYERYDVYLAKLPNAKGSEQHGVRPVVIWNVGNYDGAWDEYITTLNCFCLTTEEKNKLPVHFLIKANRSCLKEDSTFLAEQAVMLHEENLLYKLGNIADKEYRYMIFKTIDIQISNKPRIMFKYSYNFLVRVYDISSTIQAVWNLNEDGVFNTQEFKSEAKRIYEESMVKLRLVCKENNVITSTFITDLSNDCIDFSLLDL